MPKPDPLKLDPNEILTAEFEYIAQTAFQANEDRARVASFYLASVGSFIAAIFGTQFLDKSFNPEIVHFGFSGLFALLTVLGTLTIIQLSRLRSAWHESAQAMNQVKEFYIAKFPEMREAIRWRMETIPPKFKKDSMAHLLAIQVSILSGLTFGAAAFFLLWGLDLDSVWIWSAATLLAIVAYFVQMSIFGKPLKKGSK